MVEYVSKYMALISKRQQTSRKKKEFKKAKETKEEKKILRKIDKKK